MNTSVFEYKGWKLTKHTKSTGKTKLSLGTVYRNYDTEQKAIDDMNNFGDLAIDIMHKEYKL